MSIARNEAETIYQPAPVYAAPYDRDTRIKAYVRGRTAEPCNEQVEAVTRLLWEDSRNLEPFEQVADAPEIIDEYRRWATTLLEAARKAVM